MTEPIFLTTCEQLFLDALGLSLQRAIPSEVFRGQQNQFISPTETLKGIQVNIMFAQLAASSACNDISERHGFLPQHRHDPL